MHRPLVLALVVTLALGATAGAGAIGLVGETAADFSLTGLDGSVYGLSQYHGKVVLLNFFGYS